jgi:hypothetical protein
MAFSTANRGSSGRHEVDPFSHSLLINKTRCAFHQCNDKALFRDMSFYDWIAAF